MLRGLWFIVIGLQLAHVYVSIHHCNDSSCAFDEIKKECFALNHYDILDNCSGANISAVDSYAIFGTVNYG